MKGEEVQRRQEKIDRRVQELTSLRRLNSTLGDHVRSDYFLDGVLGHHRYLDLAETRAEYLARFAEFAGPVDAKIARLVDESMSLPVPDGQRWDVRREVRIGIVADRFLYDSLKDAAHLVPIDPHRFQEQLEGLDLLLLTSAWRGLDDEWFNVSLSGSPARRVLDTEIIPATRARGIPIAYYSKEDPPNYARFASLAKHADHVFTSAVECVPKYESSLAGDVAVSVLPFAINYIHHNPLGSMRHAGCEFVFAGSWFNHKYPERRSAAQRIFDGLLDAGADLTIIDRNLDLDAGRFADPERYLFPERYIPHLHRPLDHDVLLGLQRLLPVGINLNSVIASQSMYANRVIELQAMGTSIVSNYSAGMNSLHPHVGIPDSVLDVRQTYESLTTESIRHAQVAGIRHAFTGNTAFDRIDTITAALGLDSRSPEHTVHVSGLGDREFEAFAAAQVYAGSLSPLPAHADPRPGGRDGDIVLEIGPDTAAGPHLVQDVVNAFKYADVDEVVVRSAAGGEDLYEFISPGSPSGDVHARWVPDGAPLTGPRVGESAVSIASDLMPRFAPRVEVTARPEISIVVPVFNNGAHLRFKCFESLRRSSIFDRSHILLIDDGSTDVETIEIVDELDRSFSNVSVHRFPAGGSGSASRPRNKGLELVTTPYVTYLDPDNEQTNDGYAVLLDMVKDNGYEFAIGNMVRFKDKRITVKNASILRQVVGDDGVLADNALSRVKFQPMSIQALVADARWLQNLGIYQPVGAVGQDSYFFQQMLFHATRIGITDEPIHTYYASVSNSTVNTIGPRFYERYLPLEEDRSAWLREVGLLEDYNAKRLEPFVKGWFIRKLDFVAPEDLDECRSLICRLTGFYGKSAWEDPELARFHTLAHD